MPEFKTSSPSVRSPRGVSLGAFFFASSALLAALLGGLVYFVFDASRRTLVESAEAIGSARAETVAAAVESFLDDAERTLRGVEIRIADDADDATERTVVTAMADALDREGDVFEIAWTRAAVDRWAPDGEPLFLAPERRRIELRRSAAGPLLTHIEKGADGFVAQSTIVPMKSLAEGRADPSADSRATKSRVPDPTDHPTFRTPLRKDLAGRSIWSDLSWSTDAEKKIVVTLQKAIPRAAGGYAGVLRVALHIDRLDEFVRMAGNERESVFLCDPSGRLVTRTSDRDEFALVDDDLRILDWHRPAAVLAAVERDALRRAASSGGVASEEFVAEGRRHVVSFRPLADSQDWLIGVIVAEDDLLGSVADSRTTMLRGTAVTALVVILGGIATIVLLRRGLRHMTSRLQSMENFDFRPAAVVTPFRDVAESLTALENAKIALGAMQKYVPIDLVRTLYRGGIRPTLGGRPETLAILFTDIEGFTDIAESLAPNALAALLDDYFAAMTRAVHDHEGTVDKFIGDAVMAFWNAPHRVDRPAEKACRAVLAAIAAEKVMQKAAKENGRPRIATRFGLHFAEVLVGNFGSADRMNYTALGDGVNLAARLEGLNKLYGTHVLASRAFVDAAGGEFFFRFIDVVRVKGKTTPTEIFSLVADVGAEARETDLRYRAAFELYREGRFSVAATAFAALAPDPASVALFERCRAFEQSPPAPNWDGVFRLDHK